MRYSLVDYVLTISIPQKLRTALGITTISVGGEGSYLDNFNIEQRNDTWETTGDNTGSWIHTKSYNRVGDASLTLNMLSEQVTQLTRLFNIYFSSEQLDEGVTITLSDASSNTVVTCIDCYVKKIPGLSIQASPGTRTWQFTCGQIIFN